MDKALLVGIDKYPTCPLSQCVKDIQNTLDGIVNVFNFNPSGIRLLCDERATTSNIITRLYWLVKDAKPGDRLFFAYSGHGAQVATRNKKGEVDGLDEIICPVDFDWSDFNMIRDKDFYDIFKSVPKGVEFIWVSDSCHSGDLQKAMLPKGSKKRSFTTPIDIAWRNQQAKNKKLKTRDFSVLNVALISGCKSDEVSLETSNGGALTTALWKVLRKQPRLSVKDVMSKVVKSVKGQTPQLAGPEEIVSVPFLYKKN